MHITNTGNPPSASVQYTVVVVPSQGSFYTMRIVTLNEVNSIFIIEIQQQNKQTNKQINTIIL